MSFPNFPLRCTLYLNSDWFLRQNYQTVWFLLPLTLIFSSILSLNYSLPPLIPTTRIPVPSAPGSQILLLLCPLHVQCWKCRPDSPSYGVSFSIQLSDKAIHNFLPERQIPTVALFLFQLTLINFFSKILQLIWTQIYIYIIKNQKRRYSRRIRKSLTPDMPLTNHLFWLQAL